MATEARDPLTTLAEVLKTRARVQKAKFAVDTATKRYSDEVRRRADVLTELNKAQMELDNTALSLGYMIGRGEDDQKAVQDAWYRSYKLSQLATESELKDGV